MHSHIVVLVLCLTSTLAQTIVSFIGANDTWDAQHSPYLVVGNLTLSAGQRLTINAGVTIAFECGAYLNVEGAQLTVLGSAEQPVIFNTTFGCYWGGVQMIGVDTTVTNGAYYTGSVLSNVIISRSYIAVHVAYKTRRYKKTTQTQH